MKTLYFVGITAAGVVTIGRAASGRAIFLTWLAWVAILLWAGCAWPEDRR